MAQPPFMILPARRTRKKVYVCNGSACMCTGTQAVVEQKTERNLCGRRDRCDVLPRSLSWEQCFHYQGNNYSGDDIKNIKTILDKPERRIEDYHVEAIGTPVLTEVFPASMPLCAAEILAGIRLCFPAGRDPHIEHPWSWWCQFLHGHQTGNLSQPGQQDQVHRPQCWWRWPRCIFWSLPVGTTPTVCCWAWSWLVM